MGTQLLKANLKSTNYTYNKLPALSHKVYVGYFVNNCLAFKIFYLKKKKKSFQEVRILNFLLSPSLLPRVQQKTELESFVNLKVQLRISFQNWSSFYNLSLFSYVQSQAKGALTTRRSFKN
jgi:hypothetical protein